MFTERTQFYFDQDERSGRNSTRVSAIELVGQPYNRTLPDGTNINCNITAKNLVEDVNYRGQLPNLVSQAEEYLQPLFNESGYYSLDSVLKHGGNLSFNEAFSLTTFVCSALNEPLNDTIAHKIQALGPKDTHLLQATALLSAMSAKEAYQGLTPEEIAGMVAATIHLDTFVRIPIDESTIAFGGMGGDKGYPMNGHNTKLFSLSTLAATALAVDGSTHKHHSYPNTSKVAGQNAIEAFGARSDFHTLQAFRDVTTESNLIMTSCHDTRTLHTLSHRLRGETINHVIGPLSFTLSKETPVQGMVGVNEKVHPERITKAMEILDQKGFQKYDTAAVFCGTDIIGLNPERAQDIQENRDFLLDHVRIDEVAPPPYSTVVAFYKDGNQGTYIIDPEDFYTHEELETMKLEDLEIPNEVDNIINANIEALSGKNYTRSRYLAMTIGLGLFVRHALNQSGALDSETHRVNRNYMRECTKRAVQILDSGEALAKLQQYVEVTNKYAGNLKVE